MVNRIGIITLIAASTAAAAATYHSLEYKPLLNSETKYRVVGTFEFGAGELNLTTEIIETVKKVDDKGFTIETVQSGEVDFNGQKIPLEDTSTAVYGLDARVLNLTGPSVTPGAIRTANLGALVRPGKDVIEGDTWKAEYKEDMLTGAAQATAEFKLESFEQIEGEAAFKVTFKSSEEGGSAAASASGTFWVSQITGAVIKSETEWKNMPTAGGPVNGKYIQTLIR